ncbi:30S ribosomal protein S20 [Buchnera aphidicola]|uniref:30S ribosomal protein S20 n=1 Tax=Buchnera aphidicola TaxID=9 RepID=UPI0031B8A94B
MSNIKSAKKQSIKSKKLKKNNSICKTILKTLIKKMSYSIINKDKLLALQIWPILQSKLDRFSRKRIIHRNKAARYKSRFFLRLKSL